MRITSGIALASAFVLAMATAPAQAAVIGDFRLDGSTMNLAGGPLTLTTQGSLGATGITFAANQGTLISGFTSPSDYSFEFAFSLADLGGYRKLADFFNLTSDAGLYNLNTGLALYPGYPGPIGAFAPNQPSTVVFTRAANGDFSGYVNGVAQIAGTSASLTGITDNLYLFRDDGAVGGEASAGFVDYIRIYDTALTPAQVAGLTAPGAVTAAIPEPATWAMMLAGFSFVGGAMRYRRRQTKVIYATA
jgi:hypothetical protein